ncbi:TonB-dependent receptor [Dyadobacter sp.]|uniref:TonB-dependent receptor n=1 Tax=Dyadobacter sp. TaxID=1914288 RepID=UPI003F6EC8B2
MLRLLPLFILFFTASFAQTYTSTIRGTVRDADSGQPLVGATVQLVQGQSGTITAPDGTFRFDQLQVGRYQLTVTYVGYETIVVPEILLESGKENVVQVRLSPAGRVLQEATVLAARPVAFNSVQPITIEQTFRYAATYMDPARVATSFPGVAAANDQANGLVVRGNSPNAMQWRLEGVEIVNPNHLSNAGTFSDRPTSTGGGVNILSTQLLGTSSFLSGPFPAQYGNVTGAILDMNLRKGNDEQTEFTAQASLLGLDFAVEGPFSKKSKASYLVNYRYSFTGLLGAMGVSFGGEDIRFQDLSFNIDIPAKNGGTFTLFGMGGVSSNDFKAEPDSTLWERQKDGYNILYKNKMGAAGATYVLPFGDNASIKTVAAFSGLHTSRNSGPLYNSPITPEQLGSDDVQAKNIISLSSVLTVRPNTKNRFKLGAYLNYRYDKLNGLYAYKGFDTKLVQTFGSWNYQLAPSVTTEVGLHLLSSQITVGTETYSNSSIEPRASIKWQVSNQSQLSFSYGLHSQLQLPQLYAATFSTTTFAGNPDLGPTRSNHFVIGYQQNFGKNSSLKVEGYLQDQFQVPVNIYENFSAVNQIEGNVYLSLENKGTARNYGVEATFQKLLTDDYYLLVSGSLYNATYVVNGVRRESRFNGRHTFSFTGGKEFRSGERNTWGINAKILWLGGFRDVAINESQSREYNATIYENPYVFAVRMNDYFRPDLRIYWKKSHARHNRTLALDLQNISGTKNDAYSYYDNVEKKVVRQKQLGLIPVLSYRWEF